MKSAYELAMERLGGAPAAAFTAEQKAELADLTSLYTAKIAQVKLRAEDELRKAATGSDDPLADEKIRQRMAAEIAELEAEREGKKEALRRRFGG